MVSALQRVAAPRRFGRFRREPISAMDTGFRRYVRRGLPFVALLLCASAATPAQTPPGAAAAPAGRVFCQQSVDFRVADRTTVPERFRRFLGIWSDAAW